MGLGIVLGEALFGNWLTPNRLNTLNIPRDRRIHFDVRKLYQTGEPWVLYTRDRYGLRGAYTDPSHIDLVTIGGSTTDQRYVPDGQTWQDVLRAEFERQGKRISVVNAGIDGQSTVGHLRSFDVWFSSIPGFRPRYVLAYVGHNDLWGDPDSRYNRVLIASPLRKALLARSAFAHLLRTFRGVYVSWRRVEVLGHLAGCYERSEWTDKPLLSDAERSQLLAPRLQAYEARLRELEARIRGLGAVPIFVTQDDRAHRKEGGRELAPADRRLMNGNGRDVLEMERAFGDATMRVCREVGGGCIDLGRDLDFDASECYDCIHTTPKGSRKIGEYLYRELRDVL